MNGSNSVLVDINGHLIRWQSGSNLAKFRSFVSKPKMILEYEQRLDRALEEFKVC